MAKKLEVLYPGKTDVDANNQFGTFKNRTSDALKDGTPYEKGWASDVWGFLAHILNKALVIPSGAEENETNSQYYDTLEGLVGRRKVKFETDDLIINVQSSTTVDADAKRLSLLDSNFIPKFIDDLNITFTMPTDLEAGTSEKASHNYGLWTDSDDVQRLVPDLTGTTDSTIAGSIADSTATWLTDLVHDGDIVYNLTDLTQTKASADAAAEGQFTLEDDIFTSGDDYKIVKMSPEGLGENRERIGAAFNNGSSDFDDSTYTQIQEPKDYSEAAGDFTATSTDWTTTKALLTIKQSNDWTGLGKWHLTHNVVGVFAAAANPTQFAVAILGVVFDATTNYDQAVSLRDGANSTRGAVIKDAYCSDGTGDLIASFSTTLNINNSWGFSGPLTLDKKPTFHN